MRTHGIGLLGFMFMMICWPAFAQNRGPLLMGGRTSGMGGAAIAFGDDSSMAFLNPAGLARVPGDVLSLSASVYTWDLYRYDRFFAQESPPDFAGVGFTQRGNELRSSSISAFPASLSYLMHFGEQTHHVLGLSVLVPRAERRELNGILRLDHPFLTANSNFSTVRNDTTYYIGPSYAVKLGGASTELMIGASAFVVYTKRTVLTEQDTLAGFVPATDFNLIKLAAFNAASSYDFVGALGVQVKVGVFSAGLMVHTPSAHIAGSFEQRGNVVAAGNGALDRTDAIVDVQAKGAFQDRQPLRLGLGLALELGRFTIGADMNVLIPMGVYNRFEGTLDSTQIEEGVQPQTLSEPLVFEQQEKLVINVALGLEFKIDSTWILRAGGFTSFSSAKLAEPNLETLSAERLDRFGGSLGLGVNLGSVETAVNLVYTGGQGDVVGQDIGNSANAGQQRLAEAFQSSFSVLISGSVNLESFLGGG